MDGAGRKVRVAFSESNLFSSSLPEDVNRFSWSSSMPKRERRNSTESSNGGPEPRNSWRNTLETNIGRPLKNSFTLGFLFGDDDDDDDELRQSFLSDDEKEPPGLSLSLSVCAYNVNSAPDSMMVDSGVECDQGKRNNITLYDKT